jgi:hypothetical protein
MPDRECFPVFVLGMGQQLAEDPDGRIESDLRESILRDIRIKRNRHLVSVRLDSSHYELLIRYVFESHDHHLGSWRWQFHFVWISVDVRPSLLMVLMMMFEIVSPDGFASAITLPALRSYWI